MTPARSFAASDNVQVKSSVPEQDADGGIKTEQASPEDETEDELDEPSTARTVQTPAALLDVATPATSNLPTAGTVKDTPVRPGTADTNAPFSTAPDERATEVGAVPSTNTEAARTGHQTAGGEFEALTEHAEPNAEDIAAAADPESPSERARESQEAKMKQTELPTSENEDTQGRSASGFLGSVQEVASDSQEPPFVSSKKHTGQKTYSRRGTPSKLGLKPIEEMVKSPEIADTPAKSKKPGGCRTTATSLGTSTSGENLPEIDKILEESATNRRKVPAVIAEHNDEPDFTKTSSIDEHKAATEAATRSVSSSMKRKADTFDDDDDEDEDNVLSKTKRSKTRPAVASTDPAQATEEDEAAPSSSGRLRMPNRKKPQRKSEEQRLAEDSAGLLSSPLKESGRSRRKQTQESLDEIVVATATVKAKVTSSPHIRPTPPKLPTKSPSSSVASAALTGKVPKMLLSMSEIANDAKLKTWLKSQGGIIIEQVPSKGTNFICVVGVGVLHTTAKLLRTLAMGNLVATDEWVLRSKEAGHLLDPDGYIHEDLADTAELSRSKLFRGKTLFFTDKLVKDYGAAGWANIEILAQEAGASHVEKGTASKGGKKKGQGNVIFFGSDESDSDVKRLIEEYDRTVYHKDLLTQSILRGAVDLDDEALKLAVEASPVKKGKKR